MNGCGYAGNPDRGEPARGEREARTAPVEAAGGDVRDPFVDRNGKPLVDYHALAGDYGRALRMSFDLAGRIRAEQEMKLVSAWENELSWQDPDAWIVIDGPLRSHVRNAVGLVKSLQTQHLANSEALVAVRNDAVLNAMLNASSNASANAISK